MLNSPTHRKRRKIIKAALGAPTASISGSLSFNTVMGFLCLRICSFFVYFLFLPGSPRACFLAEITTKWYKWTDTRSPSFINSPDDCSRSRSVWTFSPFLLSLKPFARKRGERDALRRLGRTLIYRDAPTKAKEINSARWKLSRRFPIHHSTSTPDEW